MTTVTNYLSTLMHAHEGRLGNMSIRELKSICKNLKISKYSYLRKSELVKLIKDFCLVENTEKLTGQLENVIDYINPDNQVADEQPDNQVADSEPLELFGTVIDTYCDDGDVFFDAHQLSTILSFSGNSLLKKFMDEVFEFLTSENRVILKTVDGKDIITMNTPCLIQYLVWVVRNGKLMARNKAMGVMASLAGQRLNQQLTKDEQPDNQVADIQDEETDNQVADSYAKQGLFGDLDFYAEYQRTNYEFITDGKLVETYGVDASQLHQKHPDLTTFTNQAIGTEIIQVCSFLLSDARKVTKAPIYNPITQRVDIFKPDDDPTLVELLTVAKDGQYESCKMSVHNHIECYGVIMYWLSDSDKEVVAFYQPDLGKYVKVVESNDISLPKMAGLINPNNGVDWEMLINGWPNYINGMMSDYDKSKYLKEQTKAHKVVKIKFPHTDTGFTQGA